MFLWLTSDAPVILSTCMLHVGGGVCILHRIYIHKLFFKDRQKEGETIVQTNIQDELVKCLKSKTRVICDKLMYLGFSLKFNACTELLSHIVDRKCLLYVSPVVSPVFSVWCPSRSSSSCRYCPSHLSAHRALTLWHLGLQTRTASC